MIHFSQSNQFRFFLVRCWINSVLLLVLFLFEGCNGQREDPNNFDFESLDSLNQPLGWKLNHQGATKYTLDESIKQHGNQSIRISRNPGDSSFGSCSREIPISSDISKITFTGYLKAANIADGRASLWIRIEDLNGNVLFFDNMSQNPVREASDWRAYSISHSITTSQPLRCFLGILFTGSGEIWADNLKLTLERDSINKHNYDSEINKASESLNKTISDSQIKSLKNLCMVWGFLKYYHPAVGKYKYSWDSVLFRLIPSIISSSTRNSGSDALETFINSLGPVASCNNCSSLNPRNNKFPPYYNDLFGNNDISPILKQKLRFIRDNHLTDTNNPYFQLAQNVRNPLFDNEVDYATDPYPESALRFLALCRYWNIIQYMYPYRYLINENWGQVLSDFIPRFINSSNKSEYLLTNLELIGKIHDSHASINVNQILDSLKGDHILPIKTCFAEGKLVVTGFRKDSFDGKDQIAIGDVIKTIDNTSIDLLVKRFIPYTPASNYETQLFYLSSENGFLLRSNVINSTISIIHNGRTKTIDVERISLKSPSLLHEDLGTINKPAYSVLNGNIGYINPSKLLESDFDILKKTLSTTRGIIIDLRCYPLSPMPYVYGSWFKKFPSPFVRFSTNNAQMPGLFQYGMAVSNGDLEKSDTSFYQGQLVILVNAATLSQAEFTAMALSSTPNSIIVGSQTAGADGNVSSFTLPGNIQTRISGIGVCYPDLSETEGIGLKIDIPVKRSVENIRRGKDEYLERAISIINKK